MDRNASILRAVSSIYDAVLDAELWPQAFAALTEPVAGDHVIFFSEDINAGCVRFATGIGVGPDFFRRLAQAAQAGFVPARLLSMGAGRVRPLSHFFAKDVFERMPFYNEVVRPDGGFDGLLASPFREKGHVGVLAIERLRSRPDYEPADVAALQTILPHLCNALQIRMRLEEAEASQRRAYSIFDRLDSGVIIVDADARPVFTNRCADRIIKDGYGLSVNGGQLKAERADETQALHAAIANALAMADPGSRKALDADATRNFTTRLKFTTQHRPLALLATVMPLEPKNLSGFLVSQPRVLIFIAVPGAPARLDSAAIAAIFGLTPRQSELALRIAQGASLAEASAALGIARETARWHLKEIFERTDTHRQADLVRLLVQNFASACDE